MPTCECGAKIRWRDILNPFKVSYKVDVVNSEGKVIESFRVCDKCGQWYVHLKTLIDFYGEDKVIELFEETYKNEKERVD